jgi:hypothetical protein
MTSFGTPLPITAERTYGPDHPLLDVHSGLTTWVVVIDYNGTLLDPSDDKFVSLTFLKASHGLDVCSVFPELTS